MEGREHVLISLRADLFSRRSCPDVSGMRPRLLGCDLVTKADVRLNTVSDRQFSLHRAHLRWLHLCPARLLIVSCLYSLVDSCVGLNDSFTSVCISGC